jgi:[protein-PII] uridylyltransferase
MPEDVLKILQQKRDRLISNFLKDKEPSFLEKHAFLFDDYFCQSFEQSKLGLEMGINKNPYSIVALGGYGRQEQCIHSDVDLLFLFKKKVPDEAEGLIKEIVYPLWDMGFEVGHSTRTIKECVALAGEDFEVLMSLLDGRFICGISNLFVEMSEGLRKKVIQSRSRKIISMIVEDNRKRHLRFGDSTYLLEPNLKEGQGGLRDFHTILWIARIKSGLKYPKELEYLGFMSENEFADITRAVLFVQNVRNRLHHLANRKCDQLHMEFQIQIADLMKFKKKEGQEPVERFLGELHGHMELLKRQHLIFLSELGYLKTLLSKRVIFGKQTKVKGLKVNKKSMLDFTSMEAVVKSRKLMIQIFAESSRLKIPLSAEAKRIVKDLFYLIDDSFRKDGDIVKIFEHILLAPPVTFNTLNEMLDTGFLMKFIPEMKRIENRIQYNQYHIFPVDKHSLKTVWAVKSFSLPESKEKLCGTLYDEISDKKVLLWAALLHDIGKGNLKGRHSETGAKIAEKILRKAGYSPKEIETVSFLIYEHLFLINEATRRDIRDEGTSVFCARRIKDIERLKMLYLLTAADSISTGSKAWNDWTATLLRDLFLKVLKILQKGELATTEAVESVENKKKDVFALYAGKKEEPMAMACLDVMSIRYLLYIPTKDISEHIVLYNRLKESEFVWDIKKDIASDTRIVTVCAKNTPGLFSRIAGVFTLNSLDILDAQIYTWKNNVALDVFRVTPPKDRIFEDDIWKRAGKSLQSTLEHNIDLSVRLKERIVKSKPKKLHTLKKPLKVTVDNETSSFFTIIEVFAYDFPGFLFSVTDALFRCGLDIYVSKIATKVDQVVDVFYVRNFYGEKVDTTEQAEEIKTAIKKVLLNSYELEKQ